MSNLHQPDRQRQDAVPAPISPGLGPALHPRIKLSQSGSLLLDIVRFLAALAVLLDHLNDVYGANWRNIGVIGHEAVCVFFVLSGFVIRFITVTRIGTALEYSIDRVSRIYSVVLPALLFTLVCMMLARAIHPAFYSLMWGAMNWERVPGQILANILWTAQCWGYYVSAMINAPFWSLSYECIYYALYALIFYRARRAWFWVALILLIAGPSIAFLFPVWLLGAFACDMYLHLSRKGSGLRIAAAIFASLVSIAVLARRPILWLIRATDATRRTDWITRIVDRTLPFHRHLLDSGGLVPWLLEASISFYLVGSLTAVTMLFGMLLLDRYHPSLPPPVTRWTRTVADSTFTLYLFHVPMLMLIAAVIGHPIDHAPLAVAVLTGIVLTVIPISMALDRLKLWMRSALRRGLAAHLGQRPRLAEE